MACPGVPDSEEGRLGAVSGSPSGQVSIVNFGCMIWSQLISAG